MKPVIKNKNSDSIRSVIDVSEHPYRMWIKKKNNFMSGFIKNIHDRISYLTYKKVKIFHAPLQTVHVID